MVRNRKYNCMILLHLTYVYIYIYELFVILLNAGIEIDIWYQISWQIQVQLGLGMLRPPQSYCQRSSNYFSAQENTARMFPEISSPVKIYIWFTSKKSLIAHNFCVQTFWHMREITWGWGPTPNISQKNRFFFSTPKSVTLLPTRGTHTISHISRDLFGSRMGGWVSHYLSKKSSQAKHPSYNSFGDLCVRSVAWRIASGRERVKRWSSSFRGWLEVFFFVVFCWNDLRVIKQ